MSFNPSHSSTPPQSPPPQQVQWILRQVQCPFQGKSVGGSQYFCSEMASRTGCLFGHQMQPTGAPPPPQTALRANKPPPQVVPIPSRKPLTPLPEGTCVDYLLKRCNNEKDASTGNCCSKGTHFSLVELQLKLNLELVGPFVHVVVPTPPGSEEALKKKKKKRNRKKQIKTPTSHSTTGSIISETEESIISTTMHPSLSSIRTSSTRRQCKPSHQKLGALAILEKCAHTYCAKCMAEWRVRAPVECDICKVSSSVLFPWPEEIVCQKTRLQLAECFVQTAPMPVPHSDRLLSDWTWELIVVKTLIYFACYVMARFLCWL